MKIKIQNGVISFANTTYEGFVKGWNSRSMFIGKAWDLGGLLTE